MVSLVEREVPALGAGEFDAAEADGAPEDGHCVVSEGQFLCVPCGPACRHALEELTDLVFTQTVPDKAFGNAQAPDLVHGIPGKLALVDHPTTEAAQRREVKIDGPGFDGVDEIGLIGAEDRDGERVRLAITPPPVEEAAQGFAVGHDRRGGAKAGEKALDDGSDMGIGRRRAQGGLVWPAEDRDVVFLDPAGGPLEGPGFRGLFSREDRFR